MKTMHPQPSPVPVRKVHRRVQVLRCDHTGNQWSHTPHKRPTHLPIFVRGAAIRRLDKETQILSRSHPSPGTRGPLNQASVIRRLRNVWSSFPLSQIPSPADRISSSSSSSSTTQLINSPLPPTATSLATTTTMPTATHQAPIDWTPPTNLKKKIAVDQYAYADDQDDARSDFTIDMPIREFGFPLERMPSYTEEDEDRDYEWADEEEDTDALREMQDRYWNEDQAATRASFADLRLDDDDSDSTPPSSYQHPVSQKIINHRNLNHVNMSSNKIILKTVDSTSDEVSLAHYLNSESARADPWNHAVPTLEVFENDHDREAYLVTPHLMPYNAPPLQNAHDCLDFARQLLEGVAFLHEHKIARLELNPHNIGMDVGLAPIHEQKTWDRADYPVRYYILDFATAIHFGQKRTIVTEDPSTGNDWLSKMVNEDLRLSMEQDVHSLGTTLESLFKEIPYLRPLSPLLQSMTSHPSLRPTAEEALASFEKLAKSVDSNSLHRPFGASSARPPIDA